MILLHINHCYHGPGRTMKMIFILEFHPHPPPHTQQINVRYYSIRHYMVKQLWGVYGLGQIVLSMKLRFRPKIHQSLNTKK